MFRDVLGCGYTLSVDVALKGEMVEPPLGTPDADFMRRLWAPGGPASKLASLLKATKAAGGRIPLPYRAGGVAPGGGGPGGAGGRLKYSARGLGRRAFGSPENASAPPGCHDAALMRVVGDTSTNA